MPLRIKIIVGALSVVLLVILTFFIVAKVSVRGINPDYSGEIELKGLQSDVTIFFDEQAIPYIETNSEHDYAYTLGFLHAREKLFRMDLLRRAGEGTLSEIYGAETLELDLFARTIGFLPSAKAEFNAASNHTKEILTAYAQGVNAFVNEHKYKLPAEFDLLNYEPTEWKPYQSILILKLLAWEANTERLDNLKFAYLNNMATQGGQLRSLLQHYKIARPDSLAREKEPYITETRFFELNKAFLRKAGLSTTGVKAINWGVKNPSGQSVLGSAFTEELYAPCKWYFVNAKLNGRQQSGITLPGLPVILSGKNDKVTFLASPKSKNDSRYIVEEVDSLAQNIVENKFKSPIYKNHTIIKVKDSVDVDIDLMTTKHGPVISHLLFSQNKYGKLPDSKKYVVLNSDFMQASDMFNSLWQLSFANIIDEVISQSQQQKYLKFSYISSDNAGQIINSETKTVQVIKTPVKQVTTFKIGKGKKATVVAVTPPVEPHQKVDYGTRVVSNFDFIQDSIKNTYIFSKFDRDRIKRLNDLVSIDSIVTPDDGMVIQNDLYSPESKAIVVAILSAFSSVKMDNANLSESIEALKKWNLEYDAYQQVPAIISTFAIRFLENTLGDECNKEELEIFYSMGDYPFGFVYKLLSEQDNQFFDDIKTNTEEDINRVIRKSFAESLDLLEKEFGAKVALWQWGKLHKTGFQNLISYNDDSKNKVELGPFGIGGAGTTIARYEVTYTPNPKRLSDVTTANIGSTYSFVIGGSRSNEIYLLLSTGQSGLITSKHFADFTERNFSGKYIRVGFDDFIGNNTIFTKLKLTPSK